MLTLMDFKHPGIEDLLLDLQGAEKYANAYNILTKVNNYTHDELRGETGTITVLLEMLAEYLRTDVQSASAGSMTYMFNLKRQIKAQPLYDLTLFELLLYQEMIENIEKLSVPITR